MEAMGKHETGYARVPRDLYPTPAWVIAALAEHVNFQNLTVWEPACGDGRMSEALNLAGCSRVYSTDIVDYGYAGQDKILDFLSGEPKLSGSLDGIVTNPPFGKRGKLAEAFIEAGLRRIASYGGFLALLLPHEFDCAKSRRRFFGDCPDLVGKITLRKRVKWFEHPGKPKRSPKENSAWFLWAQDAPHVRQRPLLLYSPQCGALTDA
jgi:hypothetical protein